VVDGRHYATCPERGGSAPDLAAKEVAHQARDPIAVLFQREVAGVEQVQLGLGQVAQAGLRQVTPAVWRGRAGRRIGAGPNSVLRLEQWRRTAHPVVACPRISL